MKVHTIGTQSTPWEPAWMLDSAPFLGIQGNRVTSPTPALKANG